MFEPLRTHSNLPSRPASPCITVVREGSVWSNRPKLSRTCPVGMLPPSSHIREGSAWSNCHELSRTCPVGLLPPSSQCFGKVRCVRTAPNSLEPALSARFPLHHSGSGRFSIVEPPRTQSNLPCRPASPLHHSGSRRFGEVEPPRTHSKLPYRPASPCITVVRGGSVCSRWFECTAPSPTISLQGYMVCRVQYALVRGGSVHQMIRDPKYTLLLIVIIN